MATNTLEVPDYKQLQKPILWSFVSLITLVVLLWPSVQSMIEIWETSDTFTHCYFILPIFGYLLWLNKAKYANLKISPDWRPLPLILVSGFIWLIAQQAGVQVLEHFATVLILILTIWAVIGAELARKSRFALFFLIFLAPVGDELVPALMEITANLTVWAITVTGIPIYREGLFFSLPSGNWSVVEACSGVRYLIASIVLCSLYAYLQITSIKGRFAFMVLAVIVPIIANSVRAYIIVLLGHFSGNRLATGVDHLVYGWIFFGIVMFVLFSMGNYFQDKNPVDVDDTEGPYPATRTNTQNNSASTKRFSLTWLLLAISTAAGPAWAMAIQTQTSIELDSPTQNDITGILTRDSKFSNQSSQGPTPDIIFGFSDYTHLLEENYLSTNSKKIHASAYIYTDQSQGKEMVSTSNSLANSIGSQWRLGGKSSVDVTLPATTNTKQVNSYILRSAKYNMTVFMWYRINGKITNSEVYAKFYELRNRLLLKNNTSIIYILAAEGEDRETMKALTELGSHIIASTN